MIARYYEFRLFWLAYTSVISVADASQTNLFFVSMRVECTEGDLFAISSVRAEG